MGTIAASVLLIVAGWYFGQQSSLLPTIATYTYTTGKGERATISLPDGSTVLMNVASQIQIPTNFASGNRTVHLRGEALFTVTPLSGAPFTVVSGPSTTRVLGTTFVVRHYETDTAALVAVKDGKVSVGSMVLTASQLTRVTAAGASPASPAQAQHFGFAQGVLAFDDVLFPDAIPELNRWYNAEIRLGDSALLRERVSGSFEMGSLTDLVSMLEFTYHVRVVREGRVLTLYRGR